MLVALGLVVAMAFAASSAHAGTLPPGFQETTAFSGLEEPTVVRFAPDGRVFVAEKSGLIKSFDSLSDPTPTVVADLRTQVFAQWDRGLLGMALDPDWAHHPWIYILYTKDAAIGGTAPRWGTAGQTSDECPTPPGPTDDGCVVSGNLSRLYVIGDSTLPEQVLINDWCQQYASHSVGDLQFDQWGNLYASGGDGASFDFVDYGQDGSPVNPCGDPPAGPGGTQTPPTAQGGALRSQDLLSTSDPTGLNGSVIRIDVDGNPNWANPLIGSPDINARRIMAFGLRNPFRIAISNDDEIYAGDVGWGTWDEIDRFPFFGGPFNFGWPCYEGPGRQPAYDSADLSLCEGLYQSGNALGPIYSYNHASQVVPGETCPTGSTSISGLSFYYGANFPAAYRDGLFFADFSRDCIWFMPAGADGRPDPSRVQTFDAGADNPVGLQVGPDGALYYPDLHGGRIQRIAYAGAGNLPPTALAGANPRSGTAPLTVAFSSAGSGDPDGDALTYAWDLDGDGAYDDSTAASPSWTYGQNGTYTVGLQVSDGRGGTATASVVVEVGNSPPVPSIAGPLSTLKWSVGQKVNFSGSASDVQDGPLPASALSWTMIMHHCPSNCHEHTIQSWSGIAAGSFTAPDHEYPSYIELRLTATDSRGATASTSVNLNPATVKLKLASSPTGLQVGLNQVVATAPFTTTLIKGSSNSITAPTPQAKSGRSYVFSKWSDGGARTHNVTITAGRTITATFVRGGNATARRTPGGKHGHGHHGHGHGHHHGHRHRH